MLQLQRAPQTDEELWWTIKAMWGIELPRVSVCPEHVSPFEAVAHAFFGRSPNFAVWYASRGSGKSLALAVLGLTKAFISDISVTILGGSMTQSLNVREHMRVLMHSPYAPIEVVTKDQATLIEMATGKAIKPLPASQTTVRGPHPPLSLLDEVDEMDKDIYDAALGQAMEQLNTRGELIEEYIVASSTWQNPEGTFTAVIDDARMKGLPVFTWCWRELLAPNGWMSQRFIDNKKRTVSNQMWLTEYELNEPSASSRALDLDKVARYFVDYPATVRETHKGNGDHDVYVFEDPVPSAMYAVGADWAKERDKTVIAVVRYDCKPRRLVKLTRVNRRPWDVMIKMFNDDVAAYQAVGEHDKTGLGSVVNDYVDFQESTQGFVMIGRKRTQMLLDYITSFEHGEYELPHIAQSDVQGIVTDPLYRAHRAVTVADVYAPGRWDSHLPDDFAAMALAHRAIERIPMPVTADLGVRKDGTIRRADQPFNSSDPEDIMGRDGDVIVVSAQPKDTYELIAGYNGGPDIWAPTWSPN